MSAEHFRKLERMYGTAPITEYYGATIAIDDGTAAVSFEVKEDFFHAARAVHGSVYFRALDDAAFFAVSSRVPDAFIVTVSFNITFIRPVTRGRMIARGRATHVGGRMLTGEATLVDERERLLAQGTGVFTRSSATLTSEIGYR